MLINDVQYSVRSLWKHPVITCVCLATLAVGIGATTAVFSVLNWALLSPLPLANPERLVVIQQSSRNGRKLAISMPDLLAFSQGIRALDSVAAYQKSNFSLKSGGAPLKEYRGALVTRDFFSTFGIRPIIGRTFRGDDADGTLVISDSLWRGYFQSDPTIVGRPIQFDGQSELVVGVVSSSFWFPEPSCQVWRLITSDYPLLKLSGEYRFLHAVGRLTATATLRDAQTQVDVISGRLASEKPDLNANVSASIVSLSDSLIQDTRPLLLTLMAAVGAILLIAIVNIANLQMGRLILRRFELATRVAVGASQAQIVRLLMAENMTLTMSGGFLGICLALFGEFWLLKLSPLPIPVAPHLVVNSRVIVLTLLICLGTGVLLALILIIQLRGGGIHNALYEGGRGTTTGRHGRTLQKCLVVIEVAAAYSLLLTVVLTIQSFHRLSTVDVGFNTRNLLIITFRLPAQSYPDLDSLAAARRRITDRIQNIGGVESVAASSDVPLVSGFSNYFLRKGQPDLPPSKLELVDQASVGPGFFRQMGIAMRAGREFTDNDRSGGDLVAVVNETLAKRYWGNENPIGSQVRLGTSSEPTRWHTIVGVARDTRFLMSIGPSPKLFTPFSQIPQDYDDILARPVTMEVRTSIASASLVTDIREVINSSEPSAAFEITAMEDILDKSVSPSRLLARLFAFFGGISLWLSIFGIYGVVSNFTNSDSKAFGIRIALGATPRSVLVQIMRNGLGLVLIGISLGLVLSMFLSKLLRTFLFETPTLNPVLFVSAALVLTLASLIALYLPARRAAGIDPATTLKNG